MQAAAAQLESATQTAYPLLLRGWRNARRISQMALALDSGVSQRHISWLESGRARPSRDMVLTLAQALSVPLREQNELMLAAGYAAAHPERGLDSQELGAVQRAIGQMLERHDPFPAVLLDRHWNEVRLNPGAIRLRRFLLGERAHEQGSNIMRMFFDPTGMRPHIENWDELAPGLLRRIQAEAAGSAGKAAAKAMVRSLLRYPGVQERWLKPQPAHWESPVIPLKLRKGGFACRLFATITVFSQPCEVELQEVKVECFFPADQESEAALRSLD